MKTILKLAVIGALSLPFAAHAEEETVVETAPDVSTVEVTEEEMDVFRMAMADVGCTVDSEETAAALEASTGYDEATLSAIVAKLRVFDEIVDAATEGGITLVSGDCAS